MWTDKDFLGMMQNNTDLYGDEISHITGADEAWLIRYFENRLVSLFPPYSFIKSKYCEVTYEGKGDLKEERLIEGGFGLSVKQCTDIGNFIACRYHIDWLTEKPELSELTTTVVLNYIEHGYPLDETQYEIVYKPRTAESMIDAVRSALGDIAGQFCATMNKE